MNSEIDALTKRVEALEALCTSLATKLASAYQDIRSLAEQSALRGPGLTTLVIESGLEHAMLAALASVAPDKEALHASFSKYWQSLRGPLGIDDLNPEVHKAVSVTLDMLTQPLGKRVL
jgi:hypothetical protein